MMKVKRAVISGVGRLGGWLPAVLAAALVVGASAATARGGETASGGGSEQRITSNDGHNDTGRSPSTNGLKFKYQSIASDPNKSSAGVGKLSTRDLFFKMMRSVAMVGALGVAGLYASRKLMGKVSSLPGKRIKVVETTHLGSRRSLHLVTVDGREFLLGATGDSITRLADLTEAEEPTTGEDIAATGIRVESEHNTFEMELEAQTKVIEEMPEVESENGLAELLADLSATSADVRAEQRAL